METLIMQKKKLVLLKERLTFFLKNYTELTTTMRKIRNVYHSMLPQLKCVVLSLFQCSSLQFECNKHICQLHHKKSSD